MSIHMKMNKLGGKLFVSFMMIMLSLFPGWIALAESNGALTSPPPTEITTMGLFDPSHIYLDGGYGGISFTPGDPFIQVLGHTRATMDVDTIGVKPHLQKWTGVQWINVGVHPGIYEAFDDMVIDAYESYSVELGYYYRVRTEHWAIHNGVREDGVNTTSSVLIQ